MSTNNFYYNNVLFTVDDTDDDYGEIYEINKSFLLDDLQNDKYLAKRYGYHDETDNDELHSYSSTKIAEYFTDESIKYNNYYTVEVVVRTGYYSGYNYDYNIIEYSLDGYIVSVNEYENCKTTTKQSKQIENITKRITRILNNHSTELTKIGQLDNGEAIYQ